VDAPSPLDFGLDLWRLHTVAMEIIDAMEVYDQRF